MNLKAKGFTLIETLIVIFIISIVTCVALLSLHRNENKELESFANQLLEIISLAEEQALLEPNIYGLSFGNQTYQFSQWTEKNTWQLNTEKFLGMHHIPDDIEVNVKIDESKPKSNAPQIIISTNGDITPFKLTIGKHGKAPCYEIKGEADGNLVVKSLS